MHPASGKGTQRQSLLAESILEVSLSVLIYIHFKFYLQLLIQVAFL